MPADPNIFDALLAAQQRGELPTSMGTAELRELGEDLLSRSVFTARGVNAVFVSKIKEVVDALAAGEINEASARLALTETLRDLGYKPESSFPDAMPGEVPPAVRGTLQDLSSNRRLNLIIDTQRGMMVGKGQQVRGMDPHRLKQFPAWELVRVLSVEIPREWPSRWVIAGGKPRKDGRMIALKGDPIWGELGAWANFEDALGVDHPPFAFNSGMGWMEVSKQECARLNILGPNGETPEEWLASRPRTLAGKQPLPAPSLSVKDMDADVLQQFQKSTGAVVVDGTATTPDGKANLEARAAAREERRKARIDQTVSDAQAAYERRVQ
jgi:hypothetical protein